MTNVNPYRDAGGKNHNYRSETLASDSGVKLKNGETFKMDEAFDNIGKRKASQADGFYIEDYAQAIFRVALGKEGNDNYNAAHGENAELFQEVVKEIQCDKNGRKLDLNDAIELVKKAKGYDYKADSPSGEPDTGNTEPDTSNPPADSKHASDAQVKTAIDFLADKSNFELYSVRGGSSSRLEDGEYDKAIETAEKAGKKDLAAGLTQIKKDAKALSNLEHNGAHTKGSDSIVAHGDIEKAKEMFDGKKTYAEIVDKGVTEGEYQDRTKSGNNPFSGDFWNSWKQDWSRGAD